MKTLASILQNIQTISIQGSLEIVIHSLQLHSRKVGAGDCFIAVQGGTVDGHEYIEKVINQGAVAVICTQLPENLRMNVSYVLVKSTQAIGGFLASNFYENPSSKIKVIGVTGTNGKTSVATLSFNLFKALGYKVGLLSTVQNQILEEVIPATHTTPDAISLQALLYKMVQENCTHCFMEVSSHAVDQNRISGVEFTGAVFTNLTHDHLDYHKTFDNYLKAKKKFFDELPTSAFALTNADDRNGLVMLQNTNAKKQTYGLRGACNFKAKVIENNITGLYLDLNGIDFYTRLIGEFNAYNICCVYGIAILLGEEQQIVLEKLSALTPPEGRFDQLVDTTRNIVAIVDYAHTPDALKNVLQTIRVVRKGNEQVITVVGCGGDRDKSKRPIMAQVAVKFSDQVILTSDNPRSENPLQIMQEMYEGVSISDRRKVVLIADRKEAISAANDFAKNGDIILIAGKGHEKYQEISGEKFPFDDKQLVLENFAKTNFKQTEIK